MRGMKSVQNVMLCVLLSACAAWAATAATADYYQIRGGIPNSQYYFKNDTVGNQYLFFIGNSVLAGTGLKDQGLRYSAQMVKGFKRHFPSAGMNETRHMQPGGCSGTGRTSCRPAACAASRSFRRTGSAA